MKKISVKELSTAFGGGSNRQCLIDGFLTGIGTAIGFAAGGILGGAAAALAGMSTTNSDGCFG